MSDKHVPIPEEQPSAEAEAATRGRRLHHPLRKVALWLLIPVAAIVLLLAAATWYLSAGHLTEIFNARASEYFFADIHAKKCNFTLWSTFPRLSLQVDSLEVVSRTLRRPDVTDEMRRTLPDNADSLASFTHLQGSVNVIKLLAGEIELNDVELKGLKMNMVTLNDSVNNFDIIPTDPTKRVKIPHIAANRISLNDVPDFTFYSAPDSLRARASIREASMVRRADDGNAYDLRLGGDLSAIFENIKICSDLPFLFKGDINFRFDPFGISINDMGIELANTVSHVSMNMDLGDNPGLQHLSTEISTFDIMKLLAYLPTEFVPNLSGLQTDLRTGISIHLTAPYSFSSGALPSFVADLSVPASSLTYTLNSGEKYTVNDITMRASLTFNGNDYQKSSVDISEFHAMGEGLQLLLSGNIATIFSDPKFAALVKLSVDAEKLSHAIPSLLAYKMAGKADVEAKMEFPLSLIEQAKYASIPVSGRATLSNFTISPGTSRISAADGVIEFHNSADEKDMADATLRDINVILADGTSIVAPELAVTSSRTGKALYLSADIPQANLISTAEKLSVKATGVKAAIPLLSYDMTLTASAESIALNATAQGLSAVADNVDVTYPFYDKNGAFDARADKVALDPGEGKKLTANGVAASSPDFKSWTASVNSAAFSMPDPSAKDKTGKPITLDLNKLTASLRYANHNLSNMALTLGRGSLLMSAYPVPIVVSNVSAQAPSMNSFRLASLDLRSSASALSVDGTLDIDKSTAPPSYRVRANIDIDTLHFNRIANIFESGTAYHPSDDTESTPPKSTFMVPDNYDIEVSATADALVYTNLWLTDLAAKMRMKPGVLVLDTVYLSANFGQAGASLKYATPDRQDITLDAAASIRDFRLTKFFKSYPKVLAMMPQMSNLHGVFTADAYLHTDIFPSMDINTQSMIADINAAATDMYLHQNPFIHRIARMALIFREGDIHIPTIQVHAHIFDHLLEVEPFDIILDKYHLRALGRNDFAGDLYYHVGVLHNPLLPIKFGINVEGTYSRPKLHFSTADFNVHKSQMIDHIDVGDTINVIDMARHYGWLLIHHAAEADRANTHQK